MNAVECKNVSFIYPDGTIAVNDVTLSIPAGEKIAIIGPNGAGKSTFLTLLNGVHQPHGNLLIFGIPVDTKHTREIRSIVGIAFQNPDDQLFCPTIFDDVAFGPRNQKLDETEVGQRVDLALTEVGLNNYQNRSSVHLSFGERKLACIATIISMQPQIIALDEPTGNLDAFHRRKLINWIQKTDKTCIITSHDLDMILETCSNIFIMNNGKISACGETMRILKDEGLLKTFSLELPFRYQSHIKGEL